MTLQTNTTSTHARRNKVNDTMTGTSNTCPMCGQPAIEEAPKSTENMFGEWVETRLNANITNINHQGEI